MAEKENKAKQIEPKEIRNETEKKKTASKKTEVVNKSKATSKKGDAKVVSTEEIKAKSNTRKEASPKKENLKKKPTKEGSSNTNLKKKKEDSKRKESKEESTLRMNMELPGKDEKSKAEKLAESINTFENMKNEIKEIVKEEAKQKEEIFTIDSITSNTINGPGEIEIEKVLEQTTRIHMRNTAEKEIVKNAIADIFTGDYLEEPLLKEQRRTFKREIAMPKTKKVNSINPVKLTLLILIVILTITVLYFSIFTFSHFKNYNHHPKKVTLETLSPNYVFLGDSITEGYDLKKHYKKLPVVNSGRGGYQTSDILSHIQEMAYEHNPSKVFLLIGTNDVLARKEEDMIVSNIKKIIDKLHKNIPNAKVYVESIYPTNNDSVSKIVRINTSIKKYCEQNNTIYIDTFATLKNKNDNKLNNDYTKDGLHLNAEGYKKVTEMLKVYVTKKD